MMKTYLLSLVCSVLLLTGCTATPTQQPQPEQSEPEVVTIQLEGEFRDCTWIVKENGHSMTERIPASILFIDGVPTRAFVEIENQVFELNQFFYDRDTQVLTVVNTTTQDAEDTRAGLCRLY